MSVSLLLLAISPYLFHKFYEHFGLNPKYQLLAGFSFAFLTVISYITTSPILFYIKPGFGLRLDVLSGVIATSVITIGACTYMYSQRYLHDDPKQVSFNKNLSFTLCMVLFMLLSPNLLLFWLSLVGTSFYLHKLLTHFSKRKAAVRAARQKFWISRFGDVCILSASLLLFKVFGTLNFEGIAEQALNSNLMQSHIEWVSISAVLIVLAAMSKTAQLPFHFWLPNTMETPTPVSALMHAGIINSGGYLVVRMGSFLNEVPFALAGLAVVGGLTALYGSIIMLSQTSVKKSLAYSTIAQMGFMMLQCGLGAFSIAVIHIVGHAFYKAYAFLSSSSTTDFARLNRYCPKVNINAGFIQTLLFAAISMVIVFSIGQAVGYSLNKPGAIVLLTVLSLAVAQSFLYYQFKWSALKASLLMVVGYFTLFHLFEELLKSLVLTQANNVIFPYLNAFLVALFVISYLFQSQMHRWSKTKFGKLLYVKSLSGGLFVR